MDGYAGRDQHAAEDPVILLRVQRIWLRDDGVVQAVGFPGSEQTRADAEEGMARIWDLSGGRKRPLLVDMRCMKGIDRGARTFYASPEPARVLSAVALLVGSPLTRAIANFILGLSKRPVVPTRMFSSEAEANTWLRGFVE
jgi:hypothetical protein